MAKGEGYRNKGRKTVRKEFLLELVILNREVTEKSYFSGEISTLEVAAPDGSPAPNLKVPLHLYG